nr:FMN-binding protein [Oceanobacter mangrovi]
MNNPLTLLLATVCLLVGHTVLAEEFLSQQAFLEQAFEHQPATSQTLWLKPEQKQAIEAILAHPYKGLRVRYWQSADQANHRSAWILEEIGKEQPITVGIVIDELQIRSVSILAFRESRGWEVKYPFFTDQFVGQQLNNDQQLSQSVDGITGATLSVRAVTAVARVALYLAGQRQTASIH